MSTAARTTLVVAALAAVLTPVAVAALPRPGTTLKAKIGSNRGNLLLYVAQRRSGESSTPVLARILYSSTSTRDCGAGDTAPTRRLVRIDRRGRFSYAGRMLARGGPGRVNLNGRFETATRAVGTFRLRVGACDTGTLRFTARRTSP